ncbi:MAG TPA: exopolysaccharide biosynthesis polyprenyl glycosylphosphotransferase [Candidatus Binataceae bacterium]|nr:exopolysaccharide biosynthesis polyprenyl glycosylphosphotransferase [Candidatus Binataceae bacterium]
MGIPIDPVTEDEVLSRIIGDLNKGCGGWVVTPNLDQMRVLNQRPNLLDIAGEASLIIADGMPVVWASRLQGTPLPARVAGSDLVWSLTAAAARVGASVFLLGGSPGSAESAAAILARQNPNLRIAGTLCPAMGFERDPAIVEGVCEAVAKTEPDIVYSCFGFPKQEWMIGQLRRRLPRTWFLGVGGSLSMVAGELPRAPKWMQRAGLEWIHRLALEPQRLFRRYLIQDAPFAMRLFCNALYSRWSSNRRKSQIVLTKRPFSELSSAIADASIFAAGGRRLQDETSRCLIDRYESIGASTWRRKRQTWRSGFRRLSWQLLTGSTAAAKRLVDIIVSLILLILLSPLFAAITAFIKADSRGPVIFRQPRVGKWGQVFQMYKFRSMCTDAEHRKSQLLDQNEMDGGVIFKMKYDPRVTRVGKIIRRCSLDELPQLWNVLKGEMSLVGPRPPVPAEVSCYTLGERRRLEVKPGITCIWQVSGRSHLPFERQVELDVEYIESQTMWGDVKLLFKTVPAVLMGHGAY